MHLSVLLPLPQQLPLLFLLLLPHLQQYLHLLPQQFRLFPLLQSLQQLLLLFPRSHHLRHLLPVQQSDMLRHTVNRTHHLLQADFRRMDKNVYFLPSVQIYLFYISRSVPCAGQSVRKVLSVHHLPEFPFYNVCK